VADFLPREARINADTGDAFAADMVLTRGKKVIAPAGAEQF
jgi:hypothetical protein